MIALLNPIHWIYSLDRLLSRLEEILLASVLILALCFAFLQVLLRNFFDTGIPWADVFTRHLVIWIGFFGATLATKHEKHIRIDALMKVVPKRFTPLIHLIICFFCIVVGYLLYLAAYHFVMDEKMAETVLFEGIPTWYFIVIMPVGFGIITFRYVIQLINLLYRFGGKALPSDCLENESTELDISVKIKLK